jgi:hypothetical protein
MQYTFMYCGTELSHKYKLAWFLQKKISSLPHTSGYGILLITANCLQYTHTHTSVRLIQLRDKHIRFNYLIKVFTVESTPIGQAMHAGRQLLNYALCSYM